MTALNRTARWTGAAYLALAVAGMIGFLLLRPQLGAQPGAAWPWVVVCDLGVVVAQAASALGFFALYRDDRPVAAYGVATFGMGNALAVLGSAALLSAALSADAATAPLLRATADAFWTVGSVFFGLWLIPMGWFAISTRRMPAPLGWLLVVGGAGYVVTAFVDAAAPGAPAFISEMLVIPATLGELWMIAYLLVRGIRPTVPAHTAVLAPA